MIDFIKDADCTKETPVRLGVPDAPIYGKGIKLKPRVDGRTDSEHAVIIAFIANETISLVENAGLMGLPLPAVITKAIDILQKKTESEGK